MPKSKGRKILRSQRRLGVELTCGQTRNSYKLNNKALKARIYGSSVTFVYARPGLSKIFTVRAWFRLEILFDKKARADGLGIGLFQFFKALYGSLMARIRTFEVMSHK